jgi:hypothetical protein
MRCRLAVIAIGAVSALVAPATANAELAVSISGPQGPIPKGDAAEYTATVANSSGFSEPGVSLELSSYRLQSSRPVPNPFRDFSSTKGSCTPTDYPSKFGPYLTLSCAIGNLAPGASARVTASVEINESMELYASLGAYSPQDSVITYVNAPPEISGSTKLKLKGLPDGCAGESFTLKAKAKGAKKIVGRIDGPRTADGKPAPLDESVSEKLKAARGSKLKRSVEVDGLAPAFFYEIVVSAKYRNGPKQQSTALFQVCP